MQDSSDVAPLNPGDRWAPVLHRETAPPSMRLFGLIMLIGFGVLGGLLLWTGLRVGPGSMRTPAGIAMIVLGAGIALWALVAPGSVGPLYRGWMKFGLAVGTIVSTILLSLLYFAVLTPVGLLMRITGTDPLQRAPAQPGASYWKTFTSRVAAGDYGHMS